ncbi:MAG: hypothetical protein IJN67_10030 [Oscillospiraceae bacterium]|nr:hypothetical protein [Oscillospiraceae bacterium]
MLNGVIEIVAAVLFVVVSLSMGMEVVWLWVAGFYLVCGGANLLIYTLKNRHKLKKAEKTAKQAEQVAQTPAKTVEPVQTAVDAPFQELTEV